MDRLIDKLRQVAEGGLSKVAYKFWSIFQMLRKWHMKRTESPNGRGSREHSQSRLPTRSAVSAQKEPSYHQTPASALNQTFRTVQQLPVQSPWQQQTDPPHNGAPPISTTTNVINNRTPLHMLSEAANMNTERSSIPPAPGRGPPPPHWLSSSPPAGHMPPPPLMPQSDLNAGAVSMGHPGVADPSMMPSNYGMTPDQMPFTDFTSDELMAYGFGDEFMAMNLGGDNGGGWAI